MTDTADVRQACHRLPQALKALEDALGTIPASAGGTGAASGVSDRTGRLACSYIEDGRSADPARYDLELLTTALWAIRTHTCTRRHVADLVDIVNRWAPTEQRRRTITANLRAASDDKLNTTQHNNCQSHLRIGAIIPARTEGSRLCRWCEDWVRALNDPDGNWRMNVDMPTEQMVKANQDGRLLARHLPPQHKPAR